MGRPAPDEPVGRQSEPVGRYVSTGEGRVWERLLDGTPSKPPILAFHGVPVTSGVYGPLQRRLAERIGCTVACPDLPGLGRSPGPDEVSWTAQRRSLEGYVARRPGAIWVVHDIAGPIVLPLALEVDDPPAGIVLLNTILRPTEFRPPVSMQLLRTPWLGAWAARAMPRALYMHEMRRIGLGHPELVPDGMLEGLFEEAVAGLRAARLHEVMRGFELDSMTETAIERALSLPIPKLAVWGLADPSLGSQVRYLATAGAPLSIRELSDARHFLMLDHVEEVALAIEEWSSTLARRSPSHGRAEIYNRAGQGP